VLVSDGGAVFGSATDGGLLARIGRYVDIVDNQALALRKRWLTSNFIDGTMDGTYWGIGSATDNYPAGGPGYSKALAADVIASIRTDLDAFSPAEAAVLENHGYAVAAAAVTAHLSALAAPDAPPAVAPHPDWTDEEKVRVSLEKSWKRKFLGRW
jgi:NTE family protein